jgi:predicted Zn-dependent protease
MLIRLFFNFICGLSALVATALGASAQSGGKISLIRDAEIENTIRVYATPLFEAAPSLNVRSVRIHLVLDDRLNAFVAGGQRIFINTGLLRNAESANTVIGVIAHETGHIEGGHLARMQKNMSNASAIAILSAVVGTAAAVASGNPDAAIGGILAGQSMGQRSFLRYTRDMENAADQAGLRYLEQSGQSARGLLEMLESLEDQELLAGGQFSDPYLRTHPLSRERIDVVRNHVANSAFSDTPVPPDLAYTHRRMRGKLNGYIEPERSLRRYKASDRDIEARYARLFAYMEMGQTDQALEIVDELIAERPNDAFFHEARGDVLQKGSRIRESLPSYRRAVELYPQSALIRLSLAKSLLELDERAAAEEALKHLTQSLYFEPWMAHGWRLQATAYGRVGDMGGVAYALAEEALLLGRRSDADRNSAKAVELLPENSPRWNRALDIRNRLKKKPPAGD